MKVAAVPRATRTAPPAGIGVPPFAETDATVAAISTFGRASGNEPRASSNEPGVGGVVGP
jgi:hypothetical protein